MAEWDDYKRNINFIAYARHHGYETDEVESTPRGNPTNWVLRRASDNAKLLVRHTGECWVYRDMRDDTNRGTIIDFVQKEKGFPKGFGTAGFGMVLKELRAYSGAAPALSALPHAKPAVPRKVDRSAVAGIWAAAQVVELPRYLVQERQIPAALLRDRLFAGTFREDARSNIVFPTYDREGLLGVELRNRNGFRLQWPEGNTKGIWLSHSPAATKQLVLTESPIDAMSYAALFRPSKTRFVSTGGALSKAGGEYLRQLAEGLEAGSAVVLGLDNDPGGVAVAAQARQVLPPSLEVREHLPVGCKDWNDALKRDREQER